MEIMQKQLEKLGFDLRAWERLERILLMEKYDRRFRLGDAVFDLMDLRDIMTEVTEDE